MNARIASILKDRISQFTYVDKLAGLVRAISYERNGETTTIPVSDQVDDQLACDDVAMRDLVPDERYQAIVYFEDRGMQAVRSRTRGLSYKSNLRLVCWVNTAKFGGDPEAASKVMQQFIGAIDGPPYAFGPFLGIRHIVDAVPQRGPGIFSAYTYPEAKRQFLLYPFDAFALEIGTDLRVIPGCEDEVTVGNDECWTPPTLRRRRYPREFSCDELNDSSTGLTDTQKEDCLDCDGGGGPGPTLCEQLADPLVDVAAAVDCIPNGNIPEWTQVIINQDEATPEVIAVALGGASKTDAVKAIICDPCPPPDPCDPLTVTLNGVEIVNEEEPCGVDVALTCADTVDAVLVSESSEFQQNGLYTPSGVINGRLSYDCPPNHVIEWNGTQYILRDLFAGTDWITNNAPATPWAGVWVKFVGGGPAGATVAQATIADLCPCDCDPLAIMVNGESIGTVEDPCGGEANVRVVDADDNPVGSLDGTDWQIPSGTVTRDGSPYGTVLPGGSIDVPSDCPACDDATYQLKDSDNNNIGSPGSIASGGSANITAPNGSVQRQDSASVNIGLPIAVRSNQTGLALTCPDGAVTINNSVPTTLHTVAVKSNGAATQAIADSTITKPDGSTVGLPATVALDVRGYRSGIAYSFGRILWSGQTTEYRTGDEKDVYDAGFFDYTRPVYPTHYAELGADWLTMADNNIHGNTLRFTNTSGGAAATTGDRVIQDHLTGLEWYRPSSLPTAVNWNDAIDAALALSADGKTDWILPPLNCLMGLVRYESGVNLNYGGFLITTSLWSGTTNQFTTTQARTYGGGSSISEANGLKTNTVSYICCRRFI